MSDLDKVLEKLNSQDFKVRKTGSDIEVILGEGCIAKLKVQKTTLESTNTNGSVDITNFFNGYDFLILVVVDNSVDRFFIFPRDNINEDLKVEKKDKIYMYIAEKNGEVKHIKDIILPYENQWKLIVESIEYKDIYYELKKSLIKAHPIETINITKAIKCFFINNFINYKVLSTVDKSEYLVDIMVTKYKPKDLIHSDKVSTLTINHPLDYEPLLIVESEISPTSGTSAQGVMRGVVEDFNKLLLVSSKYKVMIFTSLKFEQETGDHIENRVELLHQIHQKSPSKDKAILLVHIKGSQKESGHQVQVTISDDNICGYIIGNSGGAVRI
ncbi:MAG: hypothetical protein Q8Q54_04350 [Methylococcales bacterium]|nr:hypothetical protein [Methylococcales bacterium]MDP3838133.1 hypothetical protein [Methylococcales bacterium]